MPEAPEELWTIDDVATFTKRPVKTIVDMRYRGYGPPAIKIGKAVRFYPSEVRAWVENLREPKASA